MLMLRYSDPATYGGFAASEVGQPSGYFWSAIRVNAANDVDYLYTLDGVLWRQLVNARNPAITLGALGLAITAPDTAKIAAAFDYMRVWNSALLFPGVD